MARMVPRAVTAGVLWMRLKWLGVPAGRGLEDWARIRSEIMLRVETSQFMGGGRSGELGGDRCEATNGLVDEIGRTGSVNVL